MSDWSSLERFLRTDPLDAGCAGTFALLDLYVEERLAGGDPEERFPESPFTCEAATLAWTTTKAY